MPDRATINVATIEDNSYKREKVYFWENVYGIDMSCIKPSALSEPIVDTCNKSAINSSVCKVFELDLYTATVGDLDFSSSYELSVLRNDTVHGLLTWFDIFFDKLPNKVRFSTGPYSDYTHWKQTLFYLPKDLFVEKGEVIRGSIAAKKNEKNWRAIDIKLSLHQQNSKAKNSLLHLYKLK